MQCESCRLEKQNCRCSQEDESLGEAIIFGTTEFLADIITVPLDFAGDVVDVVADVIGSLLD